MMSVLLVAFALAANTVAHGLMMASPAPAHSGGIQDFAVVSASFEMLASSVKYEFQVDGYSNCCEDTGGHAGEDHSSCTADCSYLFSETEKSQPVRELRRTKRLFSALAGSGASHLFRPPIFLS